MMSSLKCRDVTPTLQVKGMSILEQSWNSYSKKYLTRSKQYDLLKVQLLLREIEKVRNKKLCVLWQSISTWVATRMAVPVDLYFCSCLRCHVSCLHALSAAPC